MPAATCSIALHLALDHATLFRPSVTLRIDHLLLYTRWQNDSWPRAEALYEVADSGCPANPAKVHVDPENPDLVPQAPPLPPRPNAELNAVAVRLASNRLKTLEGLPHFVAHVLEAPEQLAWLDLNCNKLEQIDDVLLQFPNLQV